MGSEARSRAMSIALVALVAAAVFAGTLTQQLVWDDPILVNSVEETVRAKGLGALLSSPFLPAAAATRAPSFYRPVVLFSLWLDGRSPFGAPVGYHLTNIVLHAAVSVLALLCLGRVLGSLRLALPGALLFAVHPAHVESVAFVSGRTDVLAAAFALVATLAWLRERLGAPASPLARGVALASLALGGLSKEVALVLPAALLAWDLALPGGGRAGSAAWWSRNRGWLVVWSAGAAVPVLLRVLAGVGWSNGPRGAAAVQAAVWAKNLELLVAPWPLNAYYTPDQVGLTARTALAAAVVAALVLLLRRGERAKTALLALAWAAVFLLPVSGVVALGGAIVAERYLYLPSLGLCLLFAAALGSVAPLARRQVATWLVLLPLLAVAAAGTIARCRSWKDELTLFSGLVRTSPRYATGWNNLGNTYADLGRLGEAVEAYREAVRVDPGYAEAFFNLGAAYARQFRWQEAVRANREADRLLPGQYATLYNCGVGLAALGDTRAAAELFQEVTRLAPDFAPGHYQLARAALALGEQALAARETEIVRRLDSTLAAGLGAGAR